MTPGCWFLHDILLKDPSGKPIQDITAPTKLIRDPTHPNFKCWLDTKVKSELSLGYKYFKFDFLNLAGYEGAHYNKTLAPTGMAAYALGLRMIAEAVDGRAVLDYGISYPLPVGAAGHARHQGCEQMYGGVEYGMNQFAGGWWLNNLYSWLDPDTVAFRGHYWFRPDNWTASISMDSRSRAAKAIVYGGLYKWGDDPLNTTTLPVAVELFTNKLANEMWSVARAGQPDTAFRPVSAWGEGGLPPFLHYAPTTFARVNGDVAVFNYIDKTRSFTVDLRDAGFRGDAAGVECEQVWESGQRLTPSRQSALSVKVAGLSSVLLKCRRNASGTMLGR